MYLELDHKLALRWTALHSNVLRITQSNLNNLELSYHFAGMHGCAEFWALAAITNVYQLSRPANNSARQFNIQTPFVGKNCAHFESFACVLQR